MTNEYIYTVFGILFIGDFSNSFLLLKILTQKHLFAGMQFSFIHMHSFCFVKYFPVSNQYYRTYHYLWVLWGQIMEGYFLILYI